MMIEITMATIGRLMKNLDMRSICLAVPRLDGIGSATKFVVTHRHSFPDFLNALDHHALAGMQVPLR